MHLQNLAEFSLIDRYCKGLGANHPETKLSVGDDAAVIQVPDDMELVISVDTMVAGVHFSDNVSPADLAKKLVAVNLSDMAAMGAEPKWTTMALTIPNYNEAWLTEFSESTDAVAQQFGVQLIGGDTTQGPLNVSMQIMGLVPLGKSLRRAGAKSNDYVYVSNTLGDAALALKLRTSSNAIRDSVAIDLPAQENLKQALHRPVPQCELGLALRDIAHSCIDVSDGLVADLSHIAKQSKVSMVLDVALIPLSETYRRIVNPLDYDLALTGGDDYQLAFTVPANKAAQLAAVSNSLGIMVTKIGHVIAQAEQAVTLVNGIKPYVLRSNAGFQHFTQRI